MFGRALWIRSFGPRLKRCIIIKNQKAFRDTCSTVYIFWGSSPHRYKVYVKNLVWGNCSKKRKLAVSICLSVFIILPSLKVDCAQRVKIYGSKQQLEVLEQLAKTEHWVLERQQSRQQELDALEQFAKTVVLYIATVIP